MRSAIHCLITAAILCGTASQAQAKIAWESSLRKAHSRASQENKLILLHFIRDNCVYCDKLDAGAFKATEVENAIAENFVPLKINVSDSKGNKKLAEMFKVDRFPMDVVVTTDGVARAHGISPQQPSRYVDMLVKTLPGGAPARPGAPAGPGPGNPNAAPQQQIAAAPAPSQTSRQQSHASLCCNACTAPGGFANHLLSPLHRQSRQHSHRFRTNWSVLEPTRMQVPA